MKRNTKWLWIMGCILIILTFLYWFIFGWVVPKTAAWTSPQKWRMLPLRQPKTIVHDYLGEPIPARNSKDSTYEEWAAGSKGKSYFLRIDFADSTAVGYSIRYNYSNWMMDRSYLIDSFSIK
jgi:hypothetical protein